MVDVTHQKCRYPNCGKQPHFGYSTEITPMFCGKHKKTGMKDIKHYFCVECKKETDNPSRANWNFQNYPGGVCCDKHKKNGMINKYPYKRQYDDNKKKKTNNPKYI